MSIRRPGGKVQMIGAHTGTKVVVRLPESAGNVYQRPEVGMNDNACAGYGLAGRLRCSKCGGTPKIVSAVGNGPVAITVSCCGGQETRTLEKSELVFTQYFFEGDA
jgi:hypothetical protein